MHKLPRGSCQGRRLESLQLQSRQILHRLARADGAPIQLFQARQRRRYCQPVLRLMAHWASCWKGSARAEQNSGTGSC
jgi:hypothetical protein